MLFQVASRIRRRLMKQLCELGLAGVMADNEPSQDSRIAWHLLPNVAWKAGDPPANAVRQSYDDLKRKRLLPGQSEGTQRAIALPVAFLRSSLQEFYTSS